LNNIGFLLPSRGSNTLLALWTWQQTVEVPYRLDVLIAGKITNNYENPPFITPYAETPGRIY
jgi:hypothetical protein